MCKFRAREAIVGAVACWWHPSEPTDAPPLLASVAQQAPCARLPSQAPSEWVGGLGPASFLSKQASKQASKFLCSLLASFLLAAADEQLRASVNRLP